MRTTGMISYEKKNIHIFHTENTQKLVHFQLIIVQSMENAFTENK